MLQTSPSLPLPSVSPASASNLTPTGGVVRFPDTPSTRQPSPPFRSGEPGARHQCHLCNRTYERPDHLNRHLKSHENERNCRCQECGKGFNRIDLLNRHRAAHARLAGSSARRRIVRACAPCITAKTKCEDERPCRRCRSRDMVCQDSEGRQSESRASDTPPQMISASDTDLLTASGEAGSSTHAVPSINADETAALLCELRQSDRDPGASWEQPAFAHLGDTASPAPGDGRLFSDFFEQVMMPQTSFGVHHAQVPPPDVSDFTQDFNLDGIDFDLSFLDGGLTRPPSPVNMRDPNSADSREDFTPKSQSGGSCANAFKQSPWSWSHWVPDHNSHTFAGQDELNVGYGRVDASDQLTSPGNAPALRVDLGHAARDRMIRVVSQVAHRRLSVPSFPSLELLEDLIRVCLLQDSNAIDSHLHAASFDCKSTPTELLLGMVSRGASFIALQPVWQMGLVIQEVVRLAIAELFERDNSTTREVMPLQTYLGWLDVGAWSGFRRKTEIALSFLQPAVTMLTCFDAFKRGCPHDQSSIPTIEDSDEQLLPKWHRWVERESLKRLLIHAFIHDAQVGLVHQKNPIFSPSHLQLALPASRQLWQAPNPQAWRAIFLESNSTAYTQVAFRELPSLLEVLSDVTLLDRMHDDIDKRLCLMACCFSLGHLVWQYRQQAKIVGASHSAKASERWLRLSSMQRNLSDDLHMLLTYCSLGKEPVELLLVLEYLLMLLHVSLEDVQVFSGKSGEEGARKVYPLIRDWTDEPQSRLAIWHAGQVFRLARSLERTKLRDFYAVVVYHSTLTMWVYGMVTLDSKRKSGQHTPAGRHARPPATTRPEDLTASSIVLLDGTDDHAAKTFTLLGQGSPALQGPSSSPILLSNAQGVMATSQAVLEGNFPFSRNGLPALVANLVNLMGELGQFTTDADRD